MLINGVHFAANDNNQYDELRRLPTAFAQRNTRRTVVLHQDDTAREEYHQGQSALGYGSYGGHHRLKVARNYFNSAAARSEALNDWTSYAADMQGLALAMSKLGDFKEALEAIDETIRVRRGLMQNDVCYEAVGVKHDILQAMAKSSPEDIAAVERLIAETQREAADLFKLQHGCPPNDRAVRVEQNEVGFSADRPIGTDNVCDCICVMIRDPVSRKTALAHVDYMTELSSLSVMLERMPQGVALEARLLGARYAPEDHGISPDGVVASFRNLKKIKNFLEGKNVNILSADINDKKQPYSVVVDPLTFELTEEVPAHPNRDEHIANILPAFVEKTRPLHLAFDLTVSPHRAPHLLSHAVCAAVSALDHAEYYDDHVDDYGSDDLAAMCYSVMALKQAYETAVEDIAVVLDDTTKRMDIALAAQQREEVIWALKHHPLHIGDRAEDFNRPLADFIRNGLFIIDAQGALQINKDGLHKVKFDARPFDKLEREEQASASLHPKPAMPGAKI